MRRWTLSAATIVMLAASSAVAQLTVSFSRVTGDFPVGTSPLDVATADFNGDGNPDVATANNDSGDVSVLFGQGNGLLIDLGATFPVGTPDLAAPSAIAVGDFNGDGKPDIVVADEIGNAVSVLLNLGMLPFFGAAINTNTGTSPEDVVVGDFNGDGKLDVATADNLDDTVTVLLGSGDGHFHPPSFCSNLSTQACTQDIDCLGGTCDALAPISVGSAPAALVAVDANGDGKLDLIVANSSGNPSGAAGSLTVLKGMGDGTFVAVSFCSNQPTQTCHIDGDCPTGGTCLAELVSTSFDTPMAIAGCRSPYPPVTMPPCTPADLNGDGHPDIVVVNEEGDTASVLLGKGDLTFQPAIIYSVASLPEGVVIGDFDGDGKLDIATSGSFDDKVSVLIGVGDGTFNAAESFDVGTAPVGIAADDLNKDQKLDIVVANSEADTASVLLNTTGEPMCTGDCDGNGQVSVSDLVTMVNIALQITPDTSSCTLGDANHDGKITVDEIVKAINNALGTCPA
jgi:VCBS repeat protein/FG-GAP repeat protein